MLDIQKSLEKFNNLDPEIILTVDSSVIAGLINIFNEKYGIELSPLVIFLTTGDFNQDNIGEYLQREFGLDKDTADKIKDEVMNMIVDPLKKRLDFLNMNPDKKMSLQDEEYILSDIFEEGLVRELSAHPVIINAVNSRIFSVLSRNLDFRKEMENALYKNLEKISHKTFAIGKKTHAPSVRNWIRDFIKHYGTDIFDNVVLTRYMTESENAKRLDESEKKLVKKLLVLYRNIKFFPLSMPSEDGTGWEIIPSPEGEESLLKAREVAGPPKTEKEKEIDELKEEEEHYVESGLERKMIEEEIQNKKKIEDLEYEAKKYSEDSLEYLAIKDEIKKLEK